MRGVRLENRHYCPALVFLPRNNEAKNYPKPLYLKNIAVCFLTKKTTTLQRVVRTFERTTTQLVHLFIEKDTIHTTPEHPFYDGTAWIKAADLRKGAKVFLFSTLLATVDSTFAQDTVCTVYNFEVERTHNYLYETGVSEWSFLTHFWH